MLFTVLFGLPLQSTPTWFYTSHLGACFRIFPSLSLHVSPQVNQVWTNFPTHNLWIVKGLQTSCLRGKKSPVMGVQCNAPSGFVGLLQWNSEESTRETLMVSVHLRSNNHRVKGISWLPNRHHLMQNRQAGNPFSKKHSLSVSNWFSFKKVVLGVILQIEETVSHHLTQALKISIPLCARRKASTINGGWVLVSEVGRRRVFVEVDRLAPASWKKTDSAWHNRQYLGGCSTVAHPHIPTLTPVSPHPPFFCFPVSTNPPQWIDPQAQEPPHPPRLTESTI